jgi:hypothetical protein
MRRQSFHDFDERDQQYTQFATMPKCMEHIMFQRSATLWQRSLAKIPYLECSKDGVNLQPKCKAREVLVIPSVMETNVPVSR